MGTKNLIEYLIIVSNNNLLLNFGMHLLVLITIACIYLIRDMKLRKYTAEGTILVLFLSVTIKALFFGNPFHAATFGIMAALAGFTLIKGKTAIETPQQNIKTIVAFVFIFLGLWYPELVKINMIVSLLLSPLGAVPCPTLITVLGMINLLYPRINTKYFAIIALFGIVYGFIGTFKLGVYFDIGLIGAAVFTIYNMVSCIRFKAEKELKV